MLFVVELASAKYLYFNALTDDVANIWVRNLRQTHINIDARISTKTRLLADNCRRFVDHNKPRQGCWFQWNTGLQTGVGVKCGIVSFAFFVLEVVCIWWRVCTACGFVRLHEFGWIGDKGNVTFLPFVLLAFMLLFNCIAGPKFKCSKQCGCVRQKMNNASTARMY